MVIEHCNVTVLLERFDLTAVLKYLKLTTQRINFKKGFDGNHQAPAKPTMVDGETSSLHNVTGPIKTGTKYTLLHNE